LDVLKTAKFRCLVPDVEEFANKTMVVPALDPATGIRIDFILSFSDYERTAIGRARRIKVGRTFVHFASLEDLVVHKMVAGRPRDIEDVESVLLKNPRYDAGYIKDRLQEFDSALDTDLADRFKSIEKCLRISR
jgi:predicted nucleotidyltransferase